MSRIGTIGGRLSSMLARRPTLFGVNRRNVELVYRHNPRSNYLYADDKVLAKAQLSAAGVPVPETLAVADGLFALPGVMRLLAEAEHFVIKPANGGGGNGIVVVGDRVADGVWQRAGGEQVTADQLHRHLADIVFGAYSRGRLWDCALVEKRIRPHDFFAALWPDGLCDVRVITLKAEPTMAMVRVPTQRSAGKANLHQGGLGLAVELGSGRVVRAFHGGRAIRVHPDSGDRLIELTVPLWTDLIEAAARAARAVPLGYLGVDLAIDAESGPLVIEINARPGLEIQNVHGLGLGAAIAGVAP